MFKSLAEFRNAIKEFKIPWRFKSKLHDDFHCTGNQCYHRIISELSAKGANKTEIIERLSGKKISEIPAEEIKTWQSWLDGKVSQINQKDKSFERVIPSLFPQKYYRGVHTSDAQIQNLKPGDIYTDYGYSWFTPKKSYAKDFSRGEDGAIIETVIPAGAKISRDIEASLECGITGINPLSSMNVVTPRNIRYEVIKKEMKDNRIYVKLKYLGI